MWKVTFLLLSLSQNLTSGEKLTKAYIHEGIGLIIPAGQIKLRKTNINSEIGLFYPTNISTNVFIDKINKIQKKVADLGNLPIINNTHHSNSYLMDLEEMISDVDYIKKTIIDIGKYTDPQKIRELNHNCQLIYEAMRPEDMDILLDEITTFSTKIPTGAYTHTVDKNSDFVSNFNHLKDTISSTRTEYLNYITEINTLAAHQIPETLPFYLESLACIESGEMESISVILCQKTKYGLYCELSLNIHKSFQYYTKYLPINYGGTIWKAENTEQTLIKTSAGQWELLSCKEDEVDYYDHDDLADFLDCTTKAYDNPCINNIETDKTTEILAHCNFTTQHNVEEVVRTELGVLVNTPDVLVKEVNPYDKSVKNILPRKAPVHIITNELLQIHIQNKDLYMRPVAGVEERKITYTRYTDEFIQKIQAKAHKSDLLEEYIEDYLLDSILGLLMIIILPITIFLCGDRLKNMQINSSWCRSDAEPEEFKNFRENKNRISKQKQQFPKPPNEILLQII